MKAKRNTARVARTTAKTADITPTEKRLIAALKKLTPDRREQIAAAYAKFARSAVRWQREDEAEAK